MGQIYVGPRNKRYPHRKGHLGIAICQIILLGDTFRHLFILYLCACYPRPHLLFLLVLTHTHTQLFNGPLSRTTRVSRCQKGKTNLDFTDARDSEWHQPGHMQVCTSLQADNHASTPPVIFCRPDAPFAAQPTTSKH